ncbi:hypothetical protein [Candidatus Chrysopegis kryptomonas]|uniref:DUF948 domain-containing protein n=1 Tax=Candidatus Chryseopegocella kryptomonas TaxID=1633643 RepID=A0A0P1MZB1_9BACT|nr:hypothetical protein [Candidatus Chrysopegis kryptomonas]CUT01366.1 protein of unknown function (DUF948) [Candidatus Chrysopegis kryptomonas]
METLIQILTALLLVSAISALVYLVIVFIRLKTLLENLNRTTTELNSKLPTILDNFQKVSEQLADVTSKAQSQFETIQNLTETFQSYFQRVKGVFSTDSSSTLEGLPSGLTKIFALIKAIRTVITKLKA